MKKLGISIDGVIRNYLDAFDKQYRKKFIFNESLVEMTEEFQYKEPTEQDLDDRTKMIEQKSRDLISLPVDSPDLLNHYQFKEIKQFENENSFRPNDAHVEFQNFNSLENRFLTPQEAMETFMYEQYPFKIFGDADEFQNATSHFNAIQAYGLKNNLFETILITDLKSAAITANYFFLHKTGCRARRVQVVENNEDKWNYCDVLVDANPEAIQLKPEGKISVKIDRLYNQYDEADYTLRGLKDLNDENLLKKLLS
ncbi:MAG: hypothetical protein WC466_06225 [Candidatus Izemoplasmatales bacterium]